MRAQCASPERLENLYRAIRTLSGCNRALLHAEDEVALLKEVCRVVVEGAGYGLAWVDRGKHDAANAPCLIAHAGFDETDIESLEKTRIAHGSDESPTDIAIRTGKASIARLEPASPRTTPWHEVESRRGITAVLSLPLRVDGDIFAAIGIGTSEPDTFGEKEVELLGEAADDLAFGIQALRTKARHRQAELEIQGLNRVLSTRVAVNHALIHASDEMALLQEVCRVLVVDCGYRLAWVAYRQDEAPLTYNPVAYEGFEEGFLALGVSWKSSAEGVAFIRTMDASLKVGQPVVMRDILNDPDAPLREEASKRGYAAAILVPLFIDGDLAGVLTLMAAQAEAFDAKEVDLLLATANDLGFGIATLRTRHRAAIAEATIKRMAYSDALTGLPNRIRLCEMLDEAIGAAKSELRPLSLLQLEVGRGRELNESLGYHEADRAQQAIAHRLERTVGSGNTVARVGECEYSVLMPSGGAEQASHLAQQILLAFQEPVELSGLSLDARPHIGVALYPGHGTDAEALIRRASVALEQGKRTHSDYAIFKGGLDQECAQRVALLGDLRRAIPRNEMRLFYQPKLQIATHTVCGSEALVRWEHPLHGLLSPDQFIKLAENSRLITPLTYWVLDTALSQRYAWHEEGIEWPVSVNLSAQDLHDPKLLERISGSFATWGAQPNWIEFELTESALMEDPKTATEILTKLKDLDAQLAIDDFGTGYSSLSYLQQLPVDTLKIDQSFVSRMTQDDGSAKIVHSIIELAHNLDLSVVAEGVEDLETLNRLGNFGCDIAQGYSISRPLSAQQFREWEIRPVKH
ncbi:GGDEF: diguanylate cyclase (GGDEF) domain protein [compost metagenome]